MTSAILKVIIFSYNWASQICRKLQVIQLEAELKDQKVKFYKTKRTKHFFKKTP